MLPATLRKVASSVLSVLYQVFCAVFVIYCALIGIGFIAAFVAVIARVEGSGGAGVFGIVGLAAFVAAIIAGIWATTMAVRKERKEREEANRKGEKAEEARQAAKRQAEERQTAGAKKRQDEADWLEAKKQAEKERLAAERAIRCIEVNPDDSVAIDGLRKLRWNDKRFLRLSVAERNRIDDFLLKVRQREDTLQADIWQGTGGPPKLGPNWIRETWRNEATVFTPWLAKHLELVSACTGLDLGFPRREVEIALAGRADVVARDKRSNSHVVIENQLDAADIAHMQKLSAYGDGLNARIRIWIAADFSSKHRREARQRNRQSESCPGDPIYYLLKLRPDPRNPISLVVGPTNSKKLT